MSGNGVDDTLTGVPAGGASVTGSAVVVPGAGRYCLAIGTRDFPLAGAPVTIGRARGATIVIDSLAVSRLHARLTVRGEAVYLEDLGSKNGTFVEGVRLDTEVEISEGASIQIGPVWLTLKPLQERQ